MFRLALVLFAFSLVPVSALDKADVLGFWTYAKAQGAVTTKFESWFAADGAFEVRTNLVVFSEISSLTGRGTWKIDGNYILMSGSGPCAEDEGNGPHACTDTSSEIDTLYFKGTGAGRILMVKDGEVDYVLGSYKGATKAWNLPDLLASTGIAMRRQLGSLAPHNMARTVSPRARRGMDIFDLCGRHVVLGNH